MRESRAARDRITDYLGVALDAPQYADANVVFCMARELIELRGLVCAARLRRLRRCVPSSALHPKHAQGDKHHGKPVRAPERAF